MVRLLAPWVHRQVADYWARVPDVALVWEDCPSDRHLFQVSGVVWVLVWVLAWVLVGSFWVVASRFLASFFQTLEFADAASVRRYPVFA